MRFNRPGRKPGAAKPPGSGRKPGSPNKKTMQVWDILAKYPGYCPIEQMILMAMDHENPVDLRFAAHKEIASYAYAKRKAVEHTMDPEMLASGVGLLGLLRAYEATETDVGVFVTPDAGGETPLYASEVRRPRSQPAFGQGSLFPEASA